MCFILFGPDALEPVMYPSYSIGFSNKFHPLYFTFAGLTYYTLPNSGRLELWSAQS